MKKLYQNPNFIEALLTILLVLLYLPILKIAQIPTSNGAIPVSICYLFSIVFLPLLIFKLPKLRMPPWYISGLYIFVILWAIIQFPFNGFSKGILHWVFGAYEMLVLANVKDELDSERIARVLERSVLAFFVSHLIFNIINWRVMYNVVFNNELAITLLSLTNGGRNLDATWLALGCFLIRRKKLRVACLLYSFAYAIIGVSRVGLIASGLCLLWIFIYDEKFGFNKKTALIWCSIAALGIGAAFALGLAQRMINKLFFGFGEGTVSFLSGRELFWKNIIPMFEAHPFGVGAGNAIPVMRRLYGFNRYEDVMHNVFFQLLMDEGIIGAIWFLCLVVALFYSQRKRADGFFRKPLAAYLLVYLVLSLVQFHGGEALMIFTLGCFLLNKDKMVDSRLPLPKKDKATL